MTISEQHPSATPAPTSDALARYLALLKPTGQADDPAATTGTAADLLARAFPTPRAAVPGLLHEGVTLLVGRPKLGKSWIALGLSVAVACGGVALGRLPVEPGAVLYLALEDGERRLQERLRQVLGDGPLPAAWHYRTRWPRLDEGGLKALGRWLGDHPDGRLVVVDTLKRIRPRQRPGAGLYDQDYDVLAPLAEVARAARACLLVVHHTRKAEAEDVLDLVSGSTGLTAAADAVLVLRRARGQAEATLAVTGRDIEDRELALRRDAATQGWTLLGDADAVRQSRAREEVLAVLRAAGAPLTPKAVAAALGKEGQYAAVKQRLWEMARAGALRNVDGRYALPERPARLDPWDAPDALTRLPRAGIIGTDGGN